MCHVCSQEARIAGRAARVDGFSIGDCPFPIGDIRAVPWLQGWDEEDNETTEAVIALEHLTKRERVHK